MTTYYITQDGSGDHNGSSYANSDSVAHHNAASYAGDDIIYLCDTIRAQVTVPSSGTSGHPITYRGDYADHACKIYGSTIVQGSAWTNESGSLWYATCDADPVSVWFINTDDSIVWGKEETLKASLTAEYEWWWDDPNNRLYVYAASDPYTRYESVEKATRQNGVLIQEKSYVTISYLDVAFCGVTDAGNGIASTRGGNLIFEYNLCHHNGDLKNGTNHKGNGLNIWNGDGHTVRYNTFYENGQIGFVAYTDNGETCDDLTVEHNTAYNNYHAQLDFFYGGGSASNSMDNAIIRYNLAYCDSDYGAHGQGPLLTHGIFVQSDHVTADITNPSICYNIVYNMYNDSLIALTTNVTGAVLYNNVVYGGFTGSTNSPGIDIRAASVTVTIKNNIGVNCVGGCLYVSDAASITACDYNLWYQSAGGTDIYTRVGAEVYHYDDFDANNNYKGDTGWDTHGLWEDPHFVDAANGDFRLQHDSPCRNAGVDVGLTSDFAGNTVPAT